MAIRRKSHADSVTKLKIFLILFQKSNIFNMDLIQPIFPIRKIDFIVGKTDH